MPVTQFTMKTLEQLGLLKMDFLGLRTLAVIKDTLDMVKKRTGQTPDIYNISFDDPKVYAMLSKGDTDGVFQLESTGMRNFMRELEPSTFEDIIAGIALYRPGPMESIPRYVKGKKEPKSVEYLHPLLEPVLDVTYGCIVYQEQVTAEAAAAAASSAESGAGRPYRRNRLHGEAEARAGLSGRGDRRHRNRRRWQRRDADGHDKKQCRNAAGKCFYRLHAKSSTSCMPNSLPSTLAGKPPMSFW